MSDQSPAQTAGRAQSASRVARAVRLSDPSVAQALPACSAFELVGLGLDGEGVDEVTEGDVDVDEVQAPFGPDEFFDEFVVCGELAEHALVDGAGEADVEPAGAVFVLALGGEEAGCADP